MGRPTLVEPDDLLAKLSLTFRDAGYDAASMALLSERTGLKRASLYHRFPGGKEQMASEVLEGAYSWLEEHMLQPLRSDMPVADRIRAMVDALERFYEDGERACLLNMLSSPIDKAGPFQSAVKQTLEAWIEALQKCLIDGGIEQKAAHDEAVRSIMLTQGALVVSRGLGKTDAFALAVKDVKRNLSDLIA